MGFWSFLSGVLNADIHLAEGFCGLGFSLDEYIGMCFVLHASVNPRGSDSRDDDERGLGFGAEDRRIKAILVDIRAR